MTYITTTEPRPTLTARTALALRRPPLAALVLLIVVAAAASVFVSITAGQKRAEKSSVGRVGQAVQAGRLERARAIAYLNAQIAGQ